MTHDRRHVHGSRHTTGDFLLFQTKPSTLENQHIRKSSVTLGRLSKVFPDILAGKAFIDLVLDRMKALNHFSVMTIRIDSFIPSGDKTVEQYAADLLMDTARIIHNESKNKSGLFGLIDRRIFCCVLPESDEACILEFVQAIRNHIADHRSETVSIGIASYPEQSFTRKQIIENARKALEHAVLIGPGSVVSFCALSLNISGDTLYARGDIQGAIREFSTGFSMDPSDVNILNSLGVCYGVIKEYDKALDTFLKAVKCDETEVMPVYNAGLISMLQGDYGRALEYFEKAKSILPVLHEPVFQIGKLYLEMDNPQAAHSCLEAASRMKPEFGLGFRYLGECRMKLDKKDEAVAAFRKAVKLNPFDAASLSALGYLIFLKGENLEIATVFCEHSVNLAPDNGLFHYRLGSLYAKSDRPDEAVQAFGRATDLGYDAVRDIVSLQNERTACAS